MSAQLGNAHDEPGDNNPGPCPGCCSIGRCFKEMIACEQFAGFVNGSKRWRSASRFPLRETYVRVVSLVRFTLWFDAKRYFHE